MNKFERRWLIACITIAAVICPVWYAWALLQDLEHAPLDVIAAVFGFAACAGWSCLVPLFVFGIPSRVVMNLVIRERRRRCVKETTILVLTFIALGAMFYSLFAYPAQG